MAEPTTPADARRHGLMRARWVAAGAAVGAAAVLTGTIAVVNAAPSSPSDGTRVVRSDDGIDDGEYVPAEPFQPQSQQSTQAPQVSPQLAQPRTHSGGS